MPCFLFYWGHLAASLRFITSLQFTFSHDCMSTSLPTGCTWEFGAMVNYIRKTYPLSQLVVVGFSLGGNIVCKYLGETQANQDKVLCCVSVCQGYSALR